MRMMLSTSSRPRPSSPLNETASTGKRRKGNTTDHTAATKTEREVSFHLTFKHNVFLSVICSLINYERRNNRPTLHVAHSICPRIAKI